MYNPKLEAWDLFPIPCLCRFPGMVDLSLAVRLKGTHYIEKKNSSLEE